ncbi:hypothetical protein ACPA9J_07160 [Pseudomonas aeruginosa]
MHLHVSLADEQGHSLFASDGPAGTPLLRQAVGGMLASLLDSLLLFCPNANSYRRFQANSYAPLAQTWGVDNRTVSLRVPGGPGLQSAYRAPHLRRRRQPLPGRRGAFLAGVHRGIREGIDPGAPVEAAAATPRPAKRLPTDWLTALDTLQGSEWAREAFGEAVPRRLPGGEARGIPAIHGRGRRAGLALVPDPGLRSRTRPHTAARRQDAPHWNKNTR